MAQKGKDNLGLIADDQALYANLPEAEQAMEHPSEETYVDMGSDLMKNTDYLEIDDAADVFKGLEEEEVQDDGQLTYANVTEEQALSATQASKSSTLQPPKPKAISIKQNGSKSKSVYAPPTPTSPLPSPKEQSAAEQQSLYSYAAPDHMSTIKVSKSSSTLDVASSGKTPLLKTSKKGRKPKGDENKQTKNDSTLKSNKESPLEVKEDGKAGKNGVKQKINVEEIIMKELTLKSTKSGETEISVTPNDQFDQNGSLKSENALSDSFGKQASLGRKDGATSTAKKKANLSYEMRELVPKPKPARLNYYRDAIARPTRWRAFLTIVILMIVLVVVTISFQVLNMLRGCCSGMQSGRLRKTEMRLKYVESIYKSRSADILLLRKSFEHQKILIKNLQSVLRIYNMTNTLMKYEEKLRKRRNVKTKKITIKVHDKLIAVNDAAIASGKSVENTKAYLSNKINNLKLIPGPKGRIGKIGHHSFVGCTTDVKMKSQYAAGNVDSFELHVGGTAPLGMKVLSVYCSSKEFKTSVYTRSASSDPQHDWHDCVCKFPVAAGQLTCKITMWVCPLID